MFTKRQIDLILELLKQEDYITSKELSISLSVSIRTIKTEIQCLNKLLESYGICILSIRGIGYKLDSIGNREIPNIKGFLKEIEKDLPLQTIPIESRMDYIVQYLIESNEAIKSDELANRLYISDSTFRKEIKQVKLFLKKYNLYIDSKPYKGIKIIGNEEDIRNCMDYLYFKKENNQNQKGVIYGDYVLDKVDRLTLILSKIVEKYKLQYPSYSLVDISIHTIISIYRNKYGYYVKSKNYNVSDVANKIINEYIEIVNEMFEITMPKEEVDRIICMIDTLYIVESGSSNNSDFDELLNEVFDEIKIKFGYDFKNTFNLYDALYHHLTQLIKRCKNDICIYNPLTKKVLFDYTLSVDFANILARKLEEKYNISISIEEFSYLVLYFNVTVYSSSHMKEKTIYIYSPDNRPKEQIILEEVKHLFSEIVYKIDVITQDELDKWNYSALDLFIYDSTLPKNIPSYVPRVIANLDDKMEFISKILITLNEPVEGYFAFDALMNNEMFYADKLLTSKDEYFEFLFDSLCESMVMDYGEAGYLYNQIEKFGQEIYKGVVLIRSQNDFVMPFMHITFLKDPLYWDYNYVKMIMFINFGDSGIEFREFVYNKLKKFISDKNNFDILYKSPSFECMVNMLR